MVKLVTLIGSFCVVLFLSGLALNTWIRHHQSYQPNLERMQTKLDILEKYQSETDILFVGTSRVERHINIPYLEEALAAQSCAANATNIGIPHLTLEEAIYILTHIKSLNMPHLKIIVFEPPMQAQHQVQRMHTDRVRHFSTLQNTYTRLINIWSYQEDIARKA